MWKPSWLLFRQLSGAGKTCVSSRWLQAPGTHFWPLPPSSSPVFSLLMTQRGAAGNVLGGKKKPNDKSCWCTFSRKSRQPLLLGMPGTPVYLCFFPFPGSLAGRSWRSTVPNHLNEKSAVAGGRCECLWIAACTTLLWAFNWAIANVYSIWKEMGINGCLITFRRFLFIFSFFLWCFSEVTKSNQSPKIRDLNHPRVFGFANEVAWGIFSQLSLNIYSCHP